ncbi:MAG: methyltransferase domain-containing protein [Polyangiaceae bacterium]|jgi:SAM-dependent methyltransferase|nr:methyltransferase domain-containing protein [Polyangiaceae bacterium]
MTTQSVVEEGGLGSGVSVEKMPGHWVLARLGKRVLRPGGLGLTARMLGGLAIGEEDDVVEFAPGLGVTARMALERRPGSYTGVERDAVAAAGVRRLLKGARQRCVEGSAMRTGLPDGYGTVVYGEAMLTMHTAAQKAAIVGEAFRVLRPGGRYGIHEMSLEAWVSEAEKAEVQRDLSAAIRVGARPLTAEEWRDVLEEQGFQVREEATAPMLLLEPQRLIEDEGALGALRIGANLLRDPGARARVLGMRRAFRRHAARIGAVALVAVKPG